MRLDTKGNLQTELGMHTSMIETLEFYVVHALHVIADPQTYKGCFDNFSRFATLIKNLPGYLDKKIDSVIDKIKDIDIY